MPKGYDMSGPSTDVLPSAASSNDATQLEPLQRMVLQTGGINMLKHQVNLEKQVHCNNLACIYPVSEDEEELEIPLNTVPLSQTLLILAPEFLLHPPHHLLRLFSRMDLLI